MIDQPEGEREAEEVMWEEDREKESDIFEDDSDEMED